MELIKTIEASQDKEKTLELILEMFLNEHIILDNDQQEEFLRELKKVIPTVSIRNEISVQHFESVFFQGNLIRKLRKKTV